MFIVRILLNHTRVKGVSLVSISLNKKGVRLGDTKSTFNLIFKFDQMKKKVISFDLNLRLWRILLFIWVFLHLAFSHYYATQSDKKPNCYFCFYLCLMLTISTIIYEYTSSFLRDQIMLSDKRSIFKSSRFFVYFITRSTNRRWENIQATLMFSKQIIRKSLKQIQNSFLIY